MRTLSLSLLLLLAGCGAFVIEPTPTLFFTGPTLEPSPQPFNAPPTEVPGSFIDTFGANNPTAAALPNDLDLPPLAISTPGAAGEAQTVQITTEGGVAYLGRLYTPESGRGPGVMLLAEQGEDWETLPNQLQSRGYTVLTITIDATTVRPTDFRDLLGSFVDFAQGDGSPLDPGRIAVGGAVSGADVALQGCASDLRCDALIVLSPTSTDPTPVEQLGERPLFMAASQDDEATFAALTALTPAASANALIQPFETAGRGTTMLQNRPDLSDLLVSWLDRQFGL